MYEQFSKQQKQNQDFYVPHAIYKHLPPKAFNKNEKKKQNLTELNDVPLPHYRCSCYVYQKKNKKKDEPT